MKAESAARKAFYTYASAEVDRAHITENGDRVSSYIPLLPRNSDEVRATELYTDAVWPTSVNDDKAYLHYGTTCPNYRKGRRADLLRLPITMDRINAANAILAFCRLVLLRRLQPLSKTASNIT